MSKFPRASRESLLGATDLVEREVELPTIGLSVLVRSLPAAYSNQAMSEALEVTTDRRGEQTARVNTSKLEALQVLHALVEPKFDTVEEVQAFAHRVGPAWRNLVDVIDEISGVNKEAVEKANAAFRAGGTSEGGPDVGDGDPQRNGTPSGSDLPLRTGT
jgi:hypothetical protein